MDNLHTYKLHTNIYNFSFVSIITFLGDRVVKRKEASTTAIGNNFLKSLTLTSLCHHSEYTSCARQNARESRGEAQWRVGHGL